MSRPEVLRERLRRAKTDEIRGWARPSSGPAAVADASAPVRNPARSASLDLKGELQARLLDEIANRGLMSASDEEIQAAVEEFIGPILEEE